MINQSPAWLDEKAETNKVKFDFFLGSGKLTQMRRTRKPAEHDRRHVHWKIRLEKYEGWINRC